jgi:hypothetical protein
MLAEADCSQVVDDFFSFHISILTCPSATALVFKQKLRQTVRQLSATTSIAQSTQLAELVAKLAVAIKTVQAIEG